MAGLEESRVLVVEDEFLIGLSLQEDLAASGYTVVGPFATLADAADAVRREQFEVAILDVNLYGQPSFPLLEEIEARGKPFILLTGYGAADLPERFAQAPRLGKPYDPVMLIKAVQRAASRAG